MNTAKPTLQTQSRKANANRGQPINNVGSIQDGTQILAISNGVPQSVTGSAYSKGPFSGASSQSTKFSRIGGATTGYVKTGHGTPADEPNARFTGNRRK